MTGKNKINCAVFISGKGSNLKSLINYSKKNNSPIKIKLVVSSKFNAKGLEHAKKNKIKILIINFNKIQNYDLKILKLIKDEKIKLICLAGFMKILSKRFIKLYKNPIINIHPSLLPKFKGLNTHERVLKSNQKFTGCTVHFVNYKLDSGKIIMQRKIKILKNDNAASLQKRVLKIEHKLYPEAINKVCSNL